MMKWPAPSSRGMTLVEIMVVLALFVVVFTLSSITLSGLIPKANTQEYTEIIVSDIKRQQMQAMQGNNIAQGVATDYGVYLDQNEYVLFEGDTYLPESETNIISSLPIDLEFSEVNLAGQQVVFSQINGEVKDYDQNNNSFILKNNHSGSEVRFELNQLGVIEVTD